LPIIAQTAYTLDVDKHKALACGCTDFISKPFEMDFFISKINELLRSDEVVKKEPRTKSQEPRKIFTINPGSDNI
jgi:DNA-binding response OmpR family regulator